MVVVLVAAVDDRRVVAQELTGCSYGTDGVEADSLCWLDLSAFTVAQATSAVGQRMIVPLSGGYTFEFTLQISGASAAQSTASALPTGSGFLGRPGIYPGVTGLPAIGRFGTGTTTYRLRDIVVRDVAGTPIGGYAIVGADGESTASTERLQFSTNGGPFELVAAYAEGCAANITGLGTQTVTCQGRPPQFPGAYGTALFSSVGPTAFDIAMINSIAGREAVAFAVQTSVVTLDKVVDGRVEPSDSFRTSVTSPEGTELGTATTGTADSSTTGEITFIPPADGSALTLAETGVGVTDLTRYSQSWSCVNDAASTTVLPTGGGPVKTVSPVPGDDITCTITNTALPPTLSLSKVFDGDRFLPGDQFTMAIRSQGPTGPVVSDPTNATTQGDGATVTPGTGTTGALAATEDTPYFLTEELAAGSSTVDDYSTAISCVDTSGVQPDLPAGEPFDGSFAIVPVLGAEISCQLINTADGHSPSLELVKSADPIDPSQFIVGQIITYSFVATNTGNVPLTDPAVGEVSFTGSGPISDIACPATPTLGVDEQLTCTATYTLTQAEIDALPQQLTNTAVATASAPDGAEVRSNESTVAIPGEINEGIGIDKSADPTTASAAGTVATYRFVVTNTGNVTLSGITVTETGFTGSGQLSAITCPAAAASMQPGAQVSCTATYTLTQTDADAGAVENTAVASGTAPTGTDVVSPPGDAVVTIPADPRLTIDKSVDPTTVSAAGTVATYRFVVTNTGNVTLTGITVTETGFTGTGAMSAITCPTTALTAGESTTCTATYPVSPADVDAGQVTNTATAHGRAPAGTDVVSPPGDAVVTIPADPRLKLDKSVDPTTVSVAGTVATYRFVVTNTGNVTLTGITVTEIDFTGSGQPTAITCPTSTLTAGESTTCTATYTITTADADAGAVNNIAVASGTSPADTSVVSPPADATITATGTATGISLNKSVDPSTVSTAGTMATYRFVVTNTGEATLTDMAVTEIDFTGSGQLSAISCPTATLTAGQSTTCTATYTVTTADLEAGRVTNTATAHGTTPTGNDVVSPPADATITANPTTFISLDKSVDPAAAAAGQTVTYDFVVTNTGNVTLTGITVTEIDFTGSGQLSAISCPTATLTAGQSTTCTATYTVTAADIDAGAVDNTAVASGTTATGVVVASTQAKAKLLPGALSQTGGPATRPVAVGTLLIFAGAVLLLISWRRPQDPRSPSPLRSKP